MKVIVTVEVEVERTEGPFASKDELADQIIEAIEQADPGSVEGENGGQYEVSEWSVNRDEEAELRTRKHRRPRKVVAK